MARWNRRNLLRACEDLLKRNDCILKVRTINLEETARCSWDVGVDGEPKNLLLVVDPSKASLVEGFLHEALHPVLGKSLGGFNEGLQEILIRAVERELWVKTMGPKVVARWRVLINRKLEGE